MAHAEVVDRFCSRLEELVNHDSPSDGTEQEWIAERVAEWLAPAGCTSRWVREPDGPARSMVITLPDGTVVGYGPLVDDAAVWDSFLDVPESSGSHVVLLGGNTVLMSTDAPESRRLFEERGFDVVAVDISEFIKLEGCVTCLSVRLRHTP